MFDLTPVSVREISLQDVAQALRQELRTLCIAPTVIALTALAGTFLITPTFTASVQLMPPQQQQSGISALLGSLNNLSSVTGAAGLKNPSDQWIGLLKSRTIADSMIKRFDLVNYYELEYMFETRNELESRSRISAGKDSLIDIEVTDEDPKRAAEMADAYVDELRRISKSLAVSEASRRRIFFESQLKDAKQQLVNAELALRATGVNPNVVNTNPDAAVSRVAQLQAQVAASEVNLSVLRESMTPDSPQVRQATAELNSLRALLHKSESGQTQASEKDGGYVQRYRDFKYYETLFELLARQFELAKSDEANDGAVIQVIDAAEVPERKSAPKRGLITAISGFLGLLLTASYILIKNRSPEKTTPTMA